MRELDKTKYIMCDKINVYKEEDYIKEVVKELKEEILERHIAGMAAPQLGYFARIICMNIGGDVHAFINPVIRKNESPKFVMEKCISLKNDKEYIVPRFTDIDIYYQEIDGKMNGYTFKDVGATTFMHLYEHLFGITIDEIYEEKPSDFENWDNETQENWLKEYSIRLEQKNESIDEEIKNDETLKEYQEKMEKFKKLSLDELRERQKNENKRKMNRAERRKLQKQLKGELKKK